MIFSFGGFKGKLEVCRKTLALKDLQTKIMKEKMMITKEKPKKFKRESRFPDTIYGKDVGRNSLLLPIIQTLGT